MMTNERIKKILDAHCIGYADLDGRIIAEGIYTELLDDTTIDGVELVELTDYTGTDLAAWLGY